MTREKTYFIYKLITNIILTNENNCDNITISKQYHIYSKEIVIMENNTISKELHYEEKLITPKSGWTALFLNTFAMLASCAGIVFSIYKLDSKGTSFLWISLIIILGLYLCIIGPILYGGLKVLKPNEALVLTLFGNYTGTLKKEGFFYVNPFSTAVNPAMASALTGAAASVEQGMPRQSQAQASGAVSYSKKISLKAMTLDNQKQKVNDELGNPIEIGIIVIWKITNTAKAVFNVENYKTFLSIQADSALRDVSRLYPYDVFSENEECNEKTLRGSSQEVAEKLKAEIQSRVQIAGLEILEARITHLAYAPEIAAAMLQRQQAAAIIAARQKIVEGAVGMVEMALASLSQKSVCELDEERKAAMVSNLLVVLCGNKDAQPIVNSGSIY
jgi:regulator of protease activity HflC (stomatin/prohibitin superfamily)